MVRPFPLVDAVRLARQNRETHRRLQGLRDDAQEQADQSQERLNRARAASVADFLNPFAEQFARLRNVDLDELPTLVAVPELAHLSVSLRTTGAHAVHGLATLASGGAMGAAAGTATFAAVGALATASTGTAIAGLSGAAATSATLAWLGGGSLAAGGMGVAGGTMVLTGVIAAPALLAVAGFTWWKGTVEHRDQLVVSLELVEAEQGLNREIQRSSAVSSRMGATATVLESLTRIGARRTPSLRLLIDRSTDYAGYAPADKAQVAEMAGLATVIASILACPVVDDDGAVSSQSHDALTVARTLHERLDR